jgi:hypothetical protein
MYNQQTRNMKKISIALATILLVTSSLQGQTAVDTVLTGGEEALDTTRIRLGKKSIEIIDQGEGTTVRVFREDQGDSMDSVAHEEFWIQEPGSPPPPPPAPEKPKKKRSKFKGHWAGFEMGLNNYLTPDYSISHSGEYGFMDLNTGRSWNFNLNFAQKSLGIVGDKFGLVSGLGMEFSNYHFDGNNSIQKLDGVIVEKPFSQNLDKSRLRTTYLTMPLMFEVQFPNVKRSKRVHLGAGVLGGLKLGSSTRVEYKESGNKQKLKEKDDFNISPFRYGLTARLGYGNFSVFGNYYMTSLFEKNKGPELYPVSVGIRLIGF